MTVVIDCNVLVMCLTSKSPYHLIYQRLVTGQYKLALTLEILLEYEEIIQQKYGLATSTGFTALLKKLCQRHHSLFPMELNLCRR